MKTFLKFKNGPTFVGKKQIRVSSNFSDDTVTITTDIWDDRRRTVSTKLWNKWNQVQQV